MHICTNYVNLTRNTVYSGILFCPTKSYSLVINVKYEVIQWKDFGKFQGIDSDRLFRVIFPHDFREFTAPLIYMANLL